MIAFLTFILLGANLADSHASQTKYLNSWSNGRQSTESTVIYESIPGSKRVKSTATVSVFGKTSEINATLEQEWKSEAELGELYIDTCASEGGIVENITVKAGTFEACKKHYAGPDVEMTKWMGKAPPFGTIRSDFKKGDIQTREELIGLSP